MRVVQTLLRRDVYRVLVALSLLLPPAFGYAQMTICTATNIAETIVTWSCIFDYMMNYYVLRYQSKVTWDCSSGMTSGCTVCLLDTLYVYAGGGWVSYDTVQVTDNAPACISGNSSTWYGSKPGLASGRHWKLTTAYKASSPTSGCNNTSGYAVSQNLFFDTF